MMRGEKHRMRFSCFWRILWWHHTSRNHLRRYPPWFCGENGRIIFSVVLSFLNASAEGGTTPSWCISHFMVWPSACEMWSDKLRLLPLMDSHKWEQFSGAEMALIWFGERKATCQFIVFDASTGRPIPSLWAASHGYCEWTCPNIFNTL